MGFADEVPTATVDRVVDTTRRALEDFPGFDLGLGPVRSLPGAVVLEAHADALAPLHERLTDAVLAARGADAVGALRAFVPHVSVAYVNRDCDPHEVMGPLDGADLSSPTPSATVTRVRLAAVTREDGTTSGPPAPSYLREGPEIHRLPRPPTGWGTLMHTRCATGSDAARRAARTGTATSWSGPRRTPISVVLLPERGGHRGYIVEKLKDELVDRVPLIDELIVMDSGSADETASVAAAGARVVRRDEVLGMVDRPGKGEALWRCIYVTHGDVVVFIDADLEQFDPQFAVGLLGPLLAVLGQFVKLFYDRRSRPVGPSSRRVAAG